MTDYDVPTIQEGFDEIKERREFEEYGDGSIVIDGEALIGLEQLYMDFNIGKRIATVRVETPRIQVIMRCSDIMVFGSLIKFEGVNDEESFQISY